MVDIPSISSSTASPSSTAAVNTAEAKHLSALLSIPVGHKTPALVTEISALTDAEKTYLLAKLNRNNGQPQINQAQTLTTHTSTKHSSASGTDQLLATLQSENTNLVKIQINHKSAHLLSALPLQLGETLSIRIRPNGQLQLVTPTETQTNANSSTGNIKPQNNTTVTQQAHNTSIKQPIHTPHSNTPQVGSTQSQTYKAAPLIPLVNTAQPTEAKLKTSQINQTIPPKVSHGDIHRAYEANTLMKHEPPHSPKAQKQLAQLQQALINVLPKAAPAATLLQTVQHIPTRLPAVAVNSPLKPIAEAVRALSQLKAAPMDVNQLIKSPTTTLNQAIERSGIFHEQRIATHAINTQRQDAVEHDVKHILLSTMQLLQSANATLNQPINSNDKPLLDQLLQLLFKPSNNPAQNKNLTSEDAQSALKQFIQRTQNSIAQIQQQQYRTASSGITEQSQSTQSFYMDLPIRLFHGFGNIFLHWQEQKITDEKNDSKDKKKGKKKANWRVYMELELGEEGNLAIELNVLEQQFKAQMWADQPDLHTKAQEHINTLKTDLESQGFTVTDIRCHAGKKSQQPITVDCSLVNIKT